MLIRQIERFLQLPAGEKRLRMRRRKSLQVAAGNASAGYLVPGRGVSAGHDGPARTPSPIRQSEEQKLRAER